MNHSQTTKTRKSLLVGAVSFIAAMTVGGVLWASDKSSSKGLPDLLGKAQPSLPKGALQVDDIKSDPKGYTGSILVRGVVAQIDPADPHLVSLIDSREARVCRSLNCAKYYLPIKVKESNLKPWDEVNVRGKMTENPSDKMVYLAADSVENLGSIKK